MVSLTTSDTPATETRNAVSQTVQDGGVGLSIPSLLDTKSWSLPGWNNNQPVPAHSVETLDQLDLSLALLARYRNTLRSFHKLSSDILLTIFLDIHAASCDPHEPHFGSYSFMSFARVCHEWRELVLSTPALWKQVSTRYPDAAEAALQRSADSMFYLVIREGAKPEDAKRVLDEVAKHVHRLRKMYLPSNMLRRDDGTMDPILEPFMKTPAPLLDTFETEKVHGEGLCIHMPQLFDGQTPQLTRLHVQYMRPLTDIIKLSCLRDLSFCGKKRSPISMGVADLLDLLEACSLLEFLTIRKVDWEPMADENPRRVRAEHLRLLDLGRTNGSITSSIIRRLDTPECSLRLKVWPDRYEGNKFHIGVPQEHQLGVGHYLHNIRKLHVNFLEIFECVVISGATDSLPFEIHALLGDDTLQNLGDMDVVASFIFRSIINTFNFEHLEEFAVTEMRGHTRWVEFTKQLWKDTFCKMPSLKSFRIAMNTNHDEGYSRVILSALSSPDDTVQGLLCPEMECLDVWGDKTWSSLQCYTTAEERHKAGHPLKRVSMSLPHYTSFDNPDDTDLPLLRRFVQTVDLEPIRISLPKWPDTLSAPSHHE